MLICNIIISISQNKMDNKDIEAGIVNEPKKTKSWFVRIMSVLLTDKALRMRGGGGKKSDSSSSSSSSGYYEIV